MKIKNILKSMLLASMLLFTTSSCSDWLNVDMEDAIMEDKLYETNEGFLASLNGVYTKMNETYSSTLGMGIIDAMAQYYDIAQNSNHIYYIYSQYNFSENTFESTQEMFGLTYIV